MAESPPNNGEGSSESQNDQLPEKLVREYYSLWRDCREEFQGVISLDQATELLTPKGNSREDKLQDMKHRYEKMLELKELLQKRGELESLHILLVAWAGEEAEKQAQGKPAKNITQVWQTDGPDRAIELIKDFLGPDDTNEGWGDEFGPEPHDPKPDSDLSVPAQWSESEIARDKVLG